jgi:hypothetical protein
MGPQDGEHNISQHEIEDCPGRENEEPTSFDWEQLYHIALTGWRSKKKEGVTGKSHVRSKSVTPISR